MIVRRSGSEPISVAATAALRSSSVRGVRAGERDGSYRLKGLDVRTATAVDTAGAVEQGDKYRYDRSDGDPPSAAFSSRTP